MGSTSFSFHLPNALALPFLSPKLTKFNSPLFITSQHKHFHINSQLNKKLKGITRKLHDVNKLSLAVQLGAFFATFQVEQPAFAITGVNNEEDLTSILIQLAIVAFGYLIVMPPIIMNWLRVRWYRRNLLEMYFQFMFVFIFFPGILVWAPFLNFRKFPRDPEMKYPWSTPQNPSQIRNSYSKFPWASPEDYD